MIEQTAAPSLVPSDRTQVHVRLSSTAREALHSLQDYYGLTQAKVFEILLREEIRRERLDGSRPVPLRWRRRSA